jgi:hypothetical protein
MNDGPYRHPAMRNVLVILGEAGPEGILSTDVARHFNVKDDWNTTISWTNRVLSHAKSVGYARRSGHRQRPPGGNGRKAAFRWWLQPPGWDYLHPEPPPQIEPLDERPNTRRVLELLKEAGEEGMRGPDIARHFTIPEPDTPSLGKLGPQSQSLQRRLTWTNQILDRFALKGYARRGNPEPSPYYHKVPAYRWFVTPEGTGYLAAGMKEGMKQARLAKEERERAVLMAHRRRLADLLTDAYDKHDPSAVTTCERERVIRELRTQGCTLHDIGGVFGLTRERVRQILKGIHVGPCRCARCADAEAG